jgi:hypothetical protein
MNNSSKELAITRVSDNSNAFLGGGRSNNGIWIWVILFIIFFIFNGGESFGFGNFNRGCGCERHHHHHHHHCRDKCDNGINGIFGENGWFILIIIAVLFLFNDGGANTNIINVDTDDTKDC